MDRRQLLHAGLLGPSLLAGILAACSADPGSGTSADGGPTPTPVPETAASPTATPAPGPRVLLAYFSRTGENYYYGDRITLEVGNTQVVADMIAASATVDVYRIEAADPYPESYSRTVDRNAQEAAGNARPANANPLPDVAEYDTVLLGSPVRNVQTPMIMRTFVEGVDLADKTAHPFVTYAVSGMGRVAQDYERLCPGSTIAEGLAVQGEEAGQARAAVEDWLRRIGI